METEIYKTPFQRLDVLIIDPESFVRAEVAEQDYRLDLLITEPPCSRRWIVAKVDADLTYCP